jgi:ferredoxin--NADP+ reductase
MADIIQGTVIGKREWSPRLISLSFEAEIKPFKAGQFVRVALNIDGEYIGRPYSFVNAPHEKPHEIYFNIVDKGQLTPRLAKLQPGDTLLLGKTANGFLTLDEIPYARHLWLLATGTGIGPFLSILRTDEPWRRFKKIILAHSVSYAGELTYQEIINDLHERYPRQFYYTPLVSREHVSHALHGRIPPNLVSGHLEQHADVPLEAAHSHVMLCGNSGMIEHTTELLVERGMKRHRRREHGQISSEQYF